MCRLYGCVFGPNILYKGSLLGRFSLDMGGFIRNWKNSKKWVVFAKFHSKSGYGGNPR